MKAKEQGTSVLPKIGAPATRALEAASYSRLEQLTKITEAELGQLHGMGPKALGILRETLKEKGMSFKTGAAGDAPKKKKGIACEPN